MLSTSMNTRLSKAAVLGAGVMGAQIAAHFANAGIPSLLLDVVSRETADRSQAARSGLARLKEMKPPPFFLPELEQLITVGNFEDDLPQLADVDWVIEAVVEDLKIKQDLLTRISPIIRPGTLVSTNTSGLPVWEISQGLRADLRSHFLGAHFFNPPRYMRLLEIIPVSQTLPETIRAAAAWGREILGKGIVMSKDTPGFLANRFGTFAVCHAIQLMFEGEYSIEAVDLLSGPLTGKPKSGIFRTLDLIGIDTFVRVADHLFNSIPGDEMKGCFKVPEPIRQMCARKLLGEKTGQGFYKRGRNANGESEISVIDFNTFQYRPRQKSQFASVEKAKGVGALGERIRALMSGQDKASEFVRKTTAAALAYASRRIPEITDHILDLDHAMRWGFQWEMGPFALWDALGFSETIPLIEQEGFKVAEWAKEMIAAGKTSLYRTEANATSLYDVAAHDYKQVSIDGKIIELSAIKQTPDRVIAENAGASLIDLGDRIWCLEFHTKMNVIGDDILRLAEQALDAFADRCDGLVIGNQAEHFSVGANLMLILMLAQEDEWDEIEAAIRRFQTVNQRIKYAQKPVVAAPHGMALGGGCEIVLHAPLVCASAESYLGLVEVGAGVIPAGGGTTEMVHRAQERGKQKKPAEALKEAFQTIALAKVSTSAYEARKLGLLRDSATFVMNRAYLLYEAKQLALSRAAQYKPFPKQKLLAMGKSLYDALASTIDGMRESGQISEHDALIAKKLARVMAGGDAPSSQEVGEQHFLDLEREVFLSLCGEKKTQERMAHILKTGKPLRN